MFVYLHVLVVTHMYTHMTGTCTYTMHNTNKHIVNLDVHVVCTCSGSYSHVHTHN